MGPPPEIDPAPIDHFPPTFLSWRGECFSTPAMEGDAVIHVLAILLLAVACALWALLRQRAGESGQPRCREATPDCGDCERAGSAARAERGVTPLRRDRQPVRRRTVYH
jgi:hypothetical protein